MISVICPSRARPGLLAEASRSCFRFASEPDRVEVLVRLDDDDRASLAALDNLRAAGVSRVIVGPQYAGYLSLADFATELTRAASGDWVMFFNDDCRAIKTGWDTALRSGRTASRVQFAQFQQDSGWGVPWAFTRSLLDAVGVIGQGGVVDKWLHDLAYELRQVRPEGFFHAADGPHFSHDRLRDSLTDEIAESSRRLCAQANVAYHGPADGERRLAQMKALIAYATT